MSGMQELQMRQVEVHIRGLFRQLRMRCLVGQELLYVWLRYFWKTIINL